MGEPPDTFACRNTATVKIVEFDAALHHQRLWDDGDVMCGRSWINNGVRAGHIIREAVTFADRDTAAILFKCRRPVGLKEEFDDGVFSPAGPSGGKDDAMLTGTNPT